MLQYMKVSTFGSAVLAFLLVVSLGCTRADKAASGASNDGGLRIISAAPSNTEIIAGLGMGDRLIAVDKYSRVIEGVPQDLVEIDFFHPDIEAVIGLEPNLVITNEINNFGAADNPFKLLSDLGIRVVQVPTSTSMAGILNDILMIAGTLGVTERGEALVDSMQKEIADIAAKKASHIVSVYFEISSFPTMVTFGQGAYLSEMIDIAGGRNIFADQKGWFSPSAEEIISRNPEVIFVLSYEGEDTVSEILDRDEFAGIRAVRDKRVFAIDGDSASRPSQNIMEAIRQMSIIFHYINYENQR